MTTRRVAIIGAGISGLACAEQLKAAGCTVELFEKSRGPSGRMSTRRGDDWQCDHGAQYFTARSPAFRAEVERWVAAGVAAGWTPRLHVFGKRAESSGEGTQRWVGTPRMTAPAAWLARALDLKLEHTVSDLRREGDSWRVVTKEQGVVPGSFDAVLLCVPAPQAVPLLAPSAPELSALAASARMRASWALMLRCTQPLAVPFDAAFINEGPLRWVARDSSKPGRPAGDVWLLHGEATWSERHLETPADEVKGFLLDAWGGWLKSIGATLPASESTLHRWRYADTEPPLGREAVFDRALGLGLCGDWLSSGRVEGAWSSGRALAQWVLG